MDNKPTALTRTTKGVGPNDQEDPAKLRAEIAETRNEMSNTIEQLHGRLNPTVLKQQALDQFHEASETIKQDLKERLQDAKETVIEEIDTVKAKLNEEIGHAKAAVRGATIGKVENMMQGARDRGRSIKEVVVANPIPATLAGVGLAWLFLAGRRRRAAELPERRPERMISATGELDWEQEERDEDRSMGRKISDAGKQTGQKVADATKDVAAKVSNVAHEARDSVSEVAHRTQDKARNLSGQARRQARRVQRRSGELYRDNPIAIGAALLAVGTIVGLAMPRTNVENRLLGRTRDDVLDKAQELAHQAMGKAGEAVKHLGESEEPKEEPSENKSLLEYH